MPFKLTKTLVLFISVNIILLTMISVINYIIDPYNFNLSDKSYFTINPINNPYLQIKLSKNKNFEYVIVGGSAIKDMKFNTINPLIADASFLHADLIDVKRVLKFWLKIHPETKTVLLPIDLHQSFNKRNININEKESTRLTLKDFYQLYISYTTTKYSLLKAFKNGNKNKNEPIDNYLYIEKKQRDQKRIDVKSTKDYITKETKEIFDILNRANVDVICFTVPMTTSYKNKQYRKHKEKIWLHILETLKYSDKIYNFSFPNHITDMKIDANNIYFRNDTHPTNAYGKIIIDSLLNTPDKTSELYEILTNKNVYRQIQKYEKQFLNSNQKKRSKN